MATKSAKERKAEQMVRERKALAKYGGKRFSVLAYGETVAALERLAQHYGFTGKQWVAETVTHIIHQVDDNVTTHKTEETPK